MRKSDTDFTSGVIWKQLIEFSVPMIIGLLFQQLYNTVDTLVVGRFVSKQALAAVGCTGNIINTLVGFCAGLATGAGVVISQSYGAHNGKRLDDAVQTSIVITFLMSVAVTVLGIVTVKPLLRMMDTPEDVMEDATTYLTIYFSGVTGVLLYNMGSGILRAVGDSRRPLYFLIFSAVVNTVLDLVFVIVFHMGVAGVAWATVIAQVLSAVLCLIVLTRTDADYRIQWKRLRISGSVFKQILSIGLPSAVQSAVTAFSNVFVQGYINSFGSAGMAGYAAYNKLDAFVLIPVQAIAMSSTTFTGQNWGAGNRERAKKGVRTALLMAIGCTVALSLVMLAMTDSLLKLFNTEEDVLEYGRYYIRVITPFYFTICFNQVYSGALRGIGNATAPTVIMLASFVAFRQLFLFVTMRLFRGGLLCVALAYPMGWVLCSTLLSIFYRRSNMFRKLPNEA